MNYYRYDITQGKFSCLLVKGNSVIFSSSFVYADNINLIMRCFQIKQIKTTLLITKVILLLSSFISRRKCFCNIKYPSRVKEKINNINSLRL